MYLTKQGINNEIIKLMLFQVLNKSTTLSAFLQVTEIKKNIELIKKSQNFR